MAVHWGTNARVEAGGCGGKRTEHCLQKVSAVGPSAVGRHRSATPRAFLLVSPQPSVVPKAQLP